MCFKRFFSHEVSTGEAVTAGICGGLGEAIYCFLIALFFSLMEKNSLVELPRTFAPLFMLLLLVVSAAVSGLLVFGYPAYLAMQQKYKSAAIAAGSAIATLAVIFLALLVIFVLI